MKEWIREAESPMKKYNPSFIRAVEEWTGEVAADYREGCDTGSEPEKHNFD